MANKKGSKIFWWFLIVLALLAGPAFYFIKEYKAARKIKYVKYGAFGIDMPVGYNIHGIDVSSYQKNIPWDVVKQMEVRKIKIGFAFIKATEGLNDVDKFFHKNWVNAKKDSMVRGAYLYFLATKNGAKQAENFIKQVTLQPGDMPPVVDIEDLYGVQPDTMLVRVKQCLNTLEKAYKVKPIIYSYAMFYKNNFTKDFDKYPLWIAHYFEPEKPKINRSFIFWQHSEKGKVDGIEGNVDFNVFNGDSADFKNLLIK